MRDDFNWIPGEFRKSSGTSNSAGGFNLARLHSKVFGLDRDYSLTPGQNPVKWAVILELRLLPHKFPTIDF